MLYLLRLARSILPPPLVDPRRSQAFGVPALLDEVPLQCDDLAVEQVVGLVDEADHGIGDDRGVRVG